MIFHRYDSGVHRTADLTGLYAGRTAFLIGGSPTLLQQDYRLLEGPSVLTFGMNNVGKTVRCRHSVFADRPECYYRSVVDDCSTIKFAKHVFNEKDAYGVRWRDVPSTFFYNQYVGTASAENVGGNDVVAGNNVMAVAMFILLSFKVRRIVLCGCSFDAGAYSDGRILDDDGFRWNSKLYEQQVGWLKSLKPTFDSLGVELVDTSVRSRLSDCFETMALCRAVEAYAGPVGADEPVRHCIQVSPGDHRVPEAARDSLSDITVFTGLNVTDRNNYDQGVRILMLAAMVHSLSKSNAGANLVFFDDCGDASNYVRSILEPLSSGLGLSIVRFSDKTKEKFARHNYLTYMSCVRCWLHDMEPDVDRCAWLDTDTVVRESLRMFMREGEAGSARGLPISGCSDYGFTGKYVNAGVLYMDLKMLRESGMGLELEKRCVEFSMMEKYNRQCDQEAVNAIPHGLLSSRWNVQLAPTAKIAPNRETDELQRTASIYHYSGAKHSCIRLDNVITDSLFDELMKVRGVLAPKAFDSMFDFSYSFHWKNKMNAFMSRKGK